MTHNRECPKCGLIVEWTRGKQVEHTMYNGDIVTAYEVHLICPEHGEFEPRAHEQVKKAFEKVERGLTKGGIM